MENHCVYHSSITPRPSAPPNGGFVDPSAPSSSPRPAPRKPRSVRLEVCQGWCCSAGGSLELLQDLERRKRRARTGGGAPGVVVEGTDCQGWCGIVPVVVLDGEAMGVPWPEEAADLWRRARGLAKGDAVQGLRSSETSTPSAPAILESPARLGERRPISTSKK